MDRQHLNDIIRNKVEEFSTRWLAYNEDDYFMVINRQNKKQALLYENPENIESGLSGIGVFFIALYKSNNDEKYLQMIERIIEVLVRHCRTNPTSNYSLYTGRAGVVYLIIQYYYLNHADARMLNIASELLIGAKEFYLDSTYVNNSLYDGRAGTLLILYELFALNRDLEILKLMESFVWKILRDGCYSDMGLYWENEEHHNVKPLCGFALGTGGIRYVLDHLKFLFPPATITFLLDQTFLYEKSCWSDTIQNWWHYRKNAYSRIEFDNLFLQYKNERKKLITGEDQLGWANGFVGACYSYSMKENTIMQTLYSALMTKVKKGLSSKILIDISLAEGLSGVGCFVLQHLDDVELSENSLLVSNIIEFVTNKSIDVPQLDESLMYGTCGVLYFLLHVITPNSDNENILCPFSKKRYSNMETGNYFSIDPSDLRLIMIRQRFYRTLNIISRDSTRIVMSKFVQGDLGPSDTIISEFLTQVRTYITTIKNADMSKRLHDLLKYEEARHLYQVSSGRMNIERYFANIDRHRNVLSYLSKHNIMEAQIVRSSTGTIVETLWDWTIDYTKSVNDLDANFGLEPSTHYSLLANLYMDEINETALDRPAIIWLYFTNEQSSVFSILKRVKDILIIIEYDQLRAWFALSSEATIENIWDYIQEALIVKLKEFLYHGILKFVK